MKLVSMVMLCFTTVYSIESTEFINDEKCSQIIDKTYITICYDYNYKAALTVSYTLQGDLVNETNIKKRPSFKVEREIDSSLRANTTDYTGSGYDRGHLAADASFDWSQESLDAVYTLANIIPQARKVNRYTWTKAERLERFIAVQLGEINVMNVVKYTSNPERIGAHQIAVPIGYYKVLYSDDQNYTKCLYYENDNNFTTADDKLQNHVVSCDTVSNSINQNKDSDGDGVDDKDDAFPLDANETVDTDNDGIGNNADLDDDNDGLSDIEEKELGTNPLHVDTDGDGVDDKHDTFPLDSERSTVRNDDENISSVSYAFLIPILSVLQ